MSGKESSVWFGSARPSVADGAFSIPLSGTPPTGCNKTVSSSAYVNNENSQN